MNNYSENCAAPLTLEEYLQICKSMNFGTQVLSSYDAAGNEPFDADDSEGGHSYYVIYHYRDHIYFRVRRYLGSYGNSDEVCGIEVVTRKEEQKIAYTYK